MKNKQLIDNSRIEIVGKILLGIIFILVLRLWYLQILKGDEFRELSQKNTIRAIRIEGVRGRILDRNGVVLAENQPGFNASIFRSGVFSPSSENWSHVFARLEIDKTLRDFPVKRYASLKKDIDWETVAWLSERKTYLPELNIEVYPRRHYPYSETLAHVLGYTGEISRGELDENRGRDYSPGDSFGKAGIEKAMEQHLRGASGGKQVLVNAYGHHIDVLAEKKPSPGSTVVLTIDYRIQKIVEDELSGKEGAIVVMNPSNGEILAMASRPAFDPNILSGRLSRGEWEEFLQTGPFFESKAFQSMYPPGSTFKPVIAAAALEEKLIQPKDTLYCPGHYTLGSHVFRCWHARGHGQTDMAEAIINSCNVYFYKLGSRAGIRNIADYARRFGFGTPTGIDLPAEAAGLIPSPEWKRTRHNQPWYPGDTVNSSIGQGYVLATPLQTAVFYSALANGGTVFAPRLIHSIKDNAGRTIWESSPRVKNELAFTPETIALIQDALKEAVKRGTGIYAQVPGAGSSGKTGTSQNPHGESHAWFAGYFPSKEPGMAIAILLEHAGQGSAAAAPLFKNIVQQTLSL